MSANIRRFGLAAAAAALSASVYTPGPQVLTFLSAVDDSDQPYALYLPKDYTQDRKYPLVVSLHGAYSNHRLNLRRVFGQGNRLGETDVRASRYFPPLKDVDFIVASPLARGTMGYQGVAEKDVLDVLADVKRQFSIDEDRVYLTGLSMGGGGTLWLGLTHPDIWAAIAPVCPAPPPGTEELAGNALNLPVKLFQGEIDPVVPAIQTRAWHKRLLDAGVKAEYVEYPGVRHNSWDNAYKDAAIFEWFAKYKRDLHPSRVRFATDSYERASAYWVRFDRLTPGDMASIDASFTAPGQLKVATTSLDGFTLRLKGHSMLKGAKTLRLVIDDARLQAPVADTLPFRRTAKGWAAGPSTPAAGEKKPGLGGPIGAAVSTGHVYVFGTKGTSGPEETTSRRETAARAADWSDPRLKLMLNFRVVSDREVIEGDFADTNLVLLGTRETNEVLEKLAALLPMHLNPGAADYGVMYVYPVGNRYAVVSSGLPWWTRLDQVKRPGLPFIPAAPRLLQSFGDFVVYRGGLDNVVVEGRFDRNWKLPAEAAAKLRATGAVEVRQ